MSTPKDILIIEDNTDISDFMMEVLRDEGYTVRSASDREQGLAEIERLPPALTLLDLHMPGIPITEFLDQLHDDGLPPIPIIIMTADSHPEDHLCLQYDVTYLFKPFDLDTLYACVAQFLPPSPTPQP